MAERGQTGVVVPVPAVEPIVGAWRERYDGSAAEGMPAHITALCPFLDHGRLTQSVIARLSEVCAELPVQDIEFHRTGHFPGVLYLDPEPADALRLLTMTIVKEWPESHPYGGAFDNVIPHLTIAQDVDDAVLSDIEDAMQRALPVKARLEEACLYVFDGARWQPEVRLPFQG